MGWTRLPPRNCFYYKSPRHGGQYLLSFVFTFGGDENEVYDFAYSFPYSYTKLQKYLDGMQRSCCCSQADLEFRFERSLLCRTNQMRRVDLIEIKDRSDGHAHLPLGKARGTRKAAKGVNGNGRIPTAKVRPVVAITGRVHPGETPASFVIQGFLDFVTSQHEDACYLRKVADIVVVPMLNPDGVSLGNYRTDATGVDLNRRWDAPSKEMEPSLYWTRELLQGINNEKDRKLDMFIDVHAHSTSKRSFMYCNPPKSMEISHLGGSEGELKEHERDWATMNSLKKVLVFLEFLDMFMLEFSLQNCRWDIDSHKLGSARRALEKMLPETLCYTFEASFFHDMGFTHSQNDSGYAQKHSKGQGQAQVQSKVNTEKGYIGMEEQLGRALSHYYRENPAGL